MRYSLGEKFRRVLAGSEERHSSFGHEEDPIEECVHLGRRLVDGQDDSLAAARQACQHVHRGAGHERVLPGRGLVAQQDRRLS